MAVQEMGPELGHRTVSDWIPGERRDKRETGREISGEGIWKHYQPMFLESLETDVATWIRADTFHSVPSFALKLQVSVSGDCSFISQQSRPE